MRTWLIAALVVAFMASGAFAHGHYVGKTDPAFGNNCCGGSDCAPVSYEAVSDVSGGYSVVLTLAQALAVNPRASSGIDAKVPHARVQPSWDSDFHVCIFPNDRTSPRGGVICLFVPMTM